MAKDNHGSSWVTSGREAERKGPEAYEEWKKKQQSNAKKRRDDYELPF